MTHGQRITAAALRDVLAENFGEPLPNAHRLAEVAGVLDQIADRHRLIELLLGPSEPLNAKAIDLRHSLKAVTGRMPDVADALGIAAAIKLGALCGSPGEDARLADLARAAAELRTAAEKFSGLLATTLPDRRIAPWHTLAISMAGILAALRTSAGAAMPDFTSPAAPIIRAVQSLLATIGETHSERAIGDALSSSSLVQSLR